MKIEIKNRYSGLLIFAFECEDNNHKKTIREAIISGADLSRADLSRANLSRANLFGADLSGADLSGANISGANLSGADISGANLSGADLSRADLSRADLSRANLFGANLSRADLSRADLSRANLDFIPLQIKGTRHSVYFTSKNDLKIGCYQKTIIEWLAEFRDIGLKNQYTDDEILEYKMYIDLAANFQKLYNL